MNLFVEAKMWEKQCYFGIYFGDIFGDPEEYFWSTFLVLFYALLVQNNKPEGLVYYQCCFAFYHL